MSTVLASRRRSLAVALGGAAAALVVAGCGGSSGGSTGSLAAGGSSQTVTTKSGSSGSYLTDGAGRALYVFSADKGITSACKGGCTAEWPAFKVSGTPKAAGSVA